MVSDTSVRYSANSQKITQLILAGAAASVAMMAFSYLLSAIGVPSPDFAGQYGAILNEAFYPPRFSGAWWGGMVWHAVNGAVLFSLLYDYLAHKQILPNQRWTKGLLYAVGLWLLNGAVVAPLSGDGAFFRLTSDPLEINLAALLSWVVYGLVLDGMLRVRMVHQLDMLSHHSVLK